LGEAGQRTVLQLAGDVDGLSCRVADEEPTDTPWLVAELTDDFQALRLGGCVRHINVGHALGGPGDRPKPWEIICSSARGAALRRELGRLAVMGEAGIPAGEVGGQVVVEDPGADLQEQMGALW